MSEFVARVRAQLDVNGLKAQLDSVTKERTVKVNVVTSGTDFLKGLNNSGLSNNAAAMGRSVGKSYSTALQNQINAVVKTQRTAFSGPLKDASKEYVNWWNKTLDKTNKQFSTLDATTASNKTLTWLKNNTKASKDYGTALRDLATKQRNATSTKELQGYNKEFRNIVSQAQVAGKTGSAETGKSATSDIHAWFVGFAPYEDPEIAVVVSGEKAGHGSTMAQIAKAVLDTYFADELKEGTNYGENMVS